jgi:hypothetical protein
MKYISTQYKPAELEAAIAVLRDTGMDEKRAKMTVQMLHARGYRVIKTGKQE